jgi:hypothetical protein
LKPRSKVELALRLHIRIRTDRLRLRYTEAAVEVDMDDQAELRAQLEVAEQRLALAVLTRSDYARVLIRLHIAALEEQLRHSPSREELRPGEAASVQARPKILLTELGFPSEEQSGIGPRALEDVVPRC